MLSIKLKICQNSIFVSVCMLSQIWTGAQKGQTRGEGGGDPAGTRCPIGQGGWPKGNAPTRCAIGEGVVPLGQAPMLEL